MPAKTRASLTSRTASEKLSNPCVTPPGRLSVVSEKRMSSVRKKAASTAAAALWPLWPEMYEGWFGVTSSGVQVESARVAALPSLSAARMAVTGRQKLYVYLASQTAK